MNQSDVEKYINTRYTTNKYRNSWKEYKYNTDCHQNKMQAM